MDISLIHSSVTNVIFALLASVFIFQSPIKEFSVVPELWLKSLLAMLLILVSEICSFPINKQSLLLISPIWL